MTADPFDRFSEGDEAELSHVVTAEDVAAFARLTGDDNPLHMDDSFAARTNFQKRVVHGMLTASFISTIIGTRLPGPGSLWAEQNLKFLAPVRIGETIRVVGKVLRKSPGQRLLTIATTVHGDDGRLVITGEAKVKVLEAQTQGDKTMQEQPKGAVIVTGGGRGIGRAVAQALAADGFPVVVAYGSSAAAAEETVESITAEGGHAVARRVDVRDGDAVAALVEFARSTYGDVAGAVSNAAPPITAKDLAALEWGDFQAQFDVQVKGTLNLAQALAPVLVQRGGGALVTIGSVAADNVPPARMAPYVAAKAALLSLTRSLATELGPKNVRVNAVSPGMTQTAFIADFPDKAKMVEKMNTPLRRLAVADDIGGVVAFLFDTRARHITGQNIRVGGGIVME